MVARIFEGLTFPKGLSYQTTPTAHPDQEKCIRSFQVHVAVNGEATIPFRVQQHKYLIRFDSSARTSQDSNEDRSKLCNYVRDSFCSFHFRYNVISCKKGTLRTTDSGKDKVWAIYSSSNYR